MLCVALVGAVALLSSCRTAGVVVAGKEQLAVAAAEVDRKVGQADERMIDSC